ncbi:MAG TPA: cupin domain-containing protein [Desulfobacterales bacterium]|nr:cupin domain-containing protein [Desulfobacterales bacterium]
MNSGNIYLNIPHHLPDEIFENIILTGGIKIERILSKGHCSPEGHWYNQEKNEWVMVLKGRAGLQFKQNENIIEMQPGDYINIPAHCEHRVEWTDSEEETIWLAVHY